MNETTYNVNLWNKRTACRMYYFYDVENGLNLIAATRHKVLKTFLQLHLHIIHNTHTNISAVSLFYI